MGSFLTGEFAGETGCRSVDPTGKRGIDPGALEVSGVGPFWKSSGGTDEPLDLLSLSSSRGGPCGITAALHKGQEILGPFYRLDASGGVGGSSVADGVPG